MVWPASPDETDDEDCSSSRKPSRSNWLCSSRSDSSPGKLRIARTQRCQPGCPLLAVASKRFIEKRGYVVPGITIQHAETSSSVRIPAYAAVEIDACLLPISLNRTLGDRTNSGYFSE